MTVKGPLPTTSLMDQAFVDAAWYRDSFATRHVTALPDVITCFIAVFGHRPDWMKQILIARNRLARAIGLAAPDRDEVLNFPHQASYRVGDCIGTWPIHALGPDEIIAGRDNSHLDFRLSIMRCQTPMGWQVRASTLCKVHNLFGRIYLVLILPFHRKGLQWLLDRALTSGRLGTPAPDPGQTA